MSGIRTSLGATGRWRRVVPAAAAIGGVAAALGVIIGVTSPGSSKGAATPKAAAGAATVQRRDLVATDTESGTLGYASPQTVYNRLSGTVTWLPTVGHVIKPGGTLYKVDNSPVVLFNGTTPAFRTLSSGVGNGPDVLELNQNLVSLGFDPSHEITVNNTWQTGTTDAVDRWQAALGETETGTITLGQIVFMPGPQLITTVDTVLGSTGGSGGSGSSGSGSSGSGSSGSSGSTGASTTVAAPRPQFVSLTSTSTTPTTTTPTTTTSTTPTTTTSTTPTTTTGTGTPPKTGGTQGSGKSGTSTGKSGSSTSQLQALVALLQAEVAELKKSLSGTGSSGSKAASSASTSHSAGGSGSSGASGSGASGSGSSGSGSSGSGSGGSGSSGGGTAQAILQTTSTQEVVTVQLDATKQTEAVVGAPVTVQLPDGSTTDGKITGVSPIAQSSSSGSGSGSGSGSSSGGSSSSPSATIPVTINLTGHTHISGLDQAAVSVNFAQQRASGVLSVPVTALIATQGGGYALQEAAAPHRLIPVTPGLFAAGYVQISGSGVYPGLAVTDSQG